MRQHLESTKPYTVPEAAPDMTFVTVYRHLIGHDPRWLIGLKRPDGELYLPKRQGNRAEKQVLISPIVISDLNSKARPA